MDILTKHQENALSLFPNSGWHTVHNLPDFWSPTRVRRPEYTAQLLKEKGYLESRVVGRNIVLGLGLYFEYRKVLAPYQ